MQSRKRTSAPEARRAWLARGRGQWATAERDSLECWEVSCEFAARHPKSLISKSYSVFLFYLSPPDWHYSII